MKKLCLLLTFCTSLANVAISGVMDSVYKFGRKTGAGVSSVLGHEKNFHLVKEGDRAPKAATRALVGVGRVASRAASLFNIINFVRGLHKPERVQLVKMIKEETGWNENRFKRWLVAHPRWAALLQFVSIEVLLAAVMMNELLLVMGLACRGGAQDFGYQDGFFDFKPSSLHVKDTMRRFSEAFNSAS